ncbi:MAG TPA: hypothetical protein VHZ73_03430 [Vicinamibacterales bacterium]|jgi:hypothetical protein|nr:hypothetical protein [Vicinamibacterales bacterium]
MKSCLVSVDLKQPSTNYIPLHTRLRDLNFEQIQGPLWAAPEALEPEDVKAALLPHVLQGDGIFVFQLDPATADYASHRN